MDKHIFTQFCAINKPKGKEKKLTKEQLLHFIINNEYSAVKFKRNYRRKKNFKETDILIFDIDDLQENGRNISDVSLALAGVNHILAPTKSHRVDKNGLICDRYRLIIFCDNVITDNKTYKFNFLKFIEEYNVTVDLRASDSSRFFFRSSHIHSYCFDQDNFKVSKVVKEEKKKEFKYRISSIDLGSELLSWVNKHPHKRCRRKRIQLIRLLMAQRNLIRRNELPQITIAEHLGVKIDTLGLWLKDLVNSGLLVHLDYIPWGKKYRAMSYKAKGALLLKILENFGLKSKKDHYMLLDNVILPQNIEDGSWDVELFYSAKAFAFDKDDSGFIKWVKSLPCWDQKEERVREAKHKWRSFRQYYQSKGII